MPRQRYKYKPPLYLRRWFQILIAIVVLGAIAATITGFLLLEPYRRQAYEFDFNEINKLEKASIIYDREGKELGRIFVLNRDPVTLEKVPHHTVNALVAAEDARFFEHDGVDYMGIVRAMLRNLKNRGFTQGASTITQQLARNAYGLNQKFGRTIERKLIEAFLAHRIEDNFSKSQILEMYLNRIYFGSGFYGVNAASKGYFGKEVSELTIEESATLCGLIKSPNRYSPYNDPEASKGQRDYVFDRMVEEQMLTKKEAAALKELPIQTVPKRKERKRSFEYAYEQVRQQVVKEIGYEAASQGGFHIYTTIDSELQLAAQQILTQHLDRIEQHPDYEGQTYEEFEKILEGWKGGDANGEEGESNRPRPTYLQGAVLVLDNETGGIRALAGGRDFEHSAFDRTVQARRKPGTAFKPFVYAAGYERGEFPGTKVEDNPIDNRYVMIGGTSGILGEWGVESTVNEPEGWIPARRALIKSKTAATVRFGLKAGLEHVVKLAEEAGIQFLTEIRDFPATFLGASEATVAEMALAYTIFPNGGTRAPEVHVIESIRDREGTVIMSVDPEEKIEVVDPYSAYQVHGALAEVLESGTGHMARDKYGLGGFPAAGKTGTAYGFTDNWFIGYTSEVTCAVWAGFDKPKTIYPGAFSNETVLPVWVDVMNEAEAQFPPEDIKPPSDALAMELCTVSGVQASEYCYHVEEVDGERLEIRDTYIEYLNPKYELRQLCSVHGPGGEINRKLMQPITKVERIDGGGAAYALNVPPVYLAAPTVIGDDPYDAVRVSIRPRPLNGQEGNGPLRPKVIGAPSGERPSSLFDRSNRPPPPPTEDGLPSIFEDLPSASRIEIPDAPPIQFD